jgi:hypothetical protein
MHRITARILVVVMVGLLALTAQAQAPQESAEPLALTETHEISDFGFTIDYPAGWFAASRKPNTVISQLGVDFQRVITDNDELPTTGITITHDHRGTAFMRSIGLPADASIEDLVQVNAGFFEWQEPFEISETEIFGMPAVSVRAVDGKGDSGVALQGFIGEEVFLLTVVAPSDEALDAFLPTWEAMLASIRPVAEPLTLTETQAFAADFGFSIDYPAGWFAEVDPSEPVTLISQLEDDHRRAFRSGNITYRGIGISHDHRDLAFMRGIGLPADASIDDLVQLNAEFFEWREPFEVIEAEVFGVSAVSVRVVDGRGNSNIVLQGFLDNRVFLFELKAPSEEALDAFLPTWEEMLESIKRVEEE